MELQTLAQRIKDACDETDTDFRNDYAGRGMMGRNCIGIVSTRQQCMAVIGEVIKTYMSSVSSAGLSGDSNFLAEVEEEFEGVVEFLLDFQMDTMGYSVIIYWEGLAPLPLEDEEHDGQPDEAQEWHDFDPDC